MKHKELHHERFSCNYCGYFYTGGYLKNHLEKVHNLSEEEVAKQMQEKQKVSGYHMKGKYDTSVCPICKASFRHSVLKNHLTNIHELDDHQIENHMKEIKVVTKDEER